MKQKLSTLLLALGLLAGTQVTAQVTNISTGVNGSGGLINYFSPDDSWTVKMPSGTAYVPVNCGGGWVQNGQGTNGCNATNVYFLSTIRWLSPYLTTCTSGPSFLNGAHIPWTIEPNPHNYYDYRIQFYVTKCEPSAVTINLSYAMCDNVFVSFIVNGTYNYTPPGTATPWAISITPANVHPGLNTLDVRVDNTGVGYDTGMGLEGNITVSGGTSVDPAFVASVTGGNLVATSPNTGSHTWEVYGSNSGLPGSFSYVGNYSTNPLSIPAAYTCYYVKHSMSVNGCGNLCAAQTICSGDCAVGPNPCNLQGPTSMSYDEATHKFNWSAVTGAVSYVLQIMPDDPACCAQTANAKKVINIPLFGTTHTLDLYHDLGIRDGKACFSWRIIPVCESGSLGTASAKHCSQGNTIPQAKTAAATGINAIGQEPLSIGTQVNIFPNPAKGSVSVDVETATDGDITVTIMDITGRTVKTFDGIRTADKKASLKWNTEAMAKGNYLVKIQSADQQVITKKLIIE